ncbi:hypothetical protein K461DRAFT_295023 [Myriangium duriaei CBS 260.36]|uniref:Metallo-beta-lactamase domain-containing protein n=1 Tax=Myriangium duriaei CBS 260.36 TaxID=1168546 RepID=A0A9P4J1X6_9PEZI|nr:hypothetical protein K461DRAFT_295023 [Myriangium duriaei CBS 260.36]
MQRRSRHPGWKGTLKSTEHACFVNKRKELPSYCILVEHPHRDVILWETGCGKAYPEILGPATLDVFARIKSSPEHELDAAIIATRRKVEDVKIIILGHLHLDHAGVLDIFMNKPDVEVWVHNRELKAVFCGGKAFPKVGLLEIMLPGPEALESSNTYNEPHKDESSSATTKNASWSYNQNPRFSLEPPQEGSGQR